jgi:hypothetical protein
MATITSINTRDLAIIMEELKLNICQMVVARNDIVRSRKENASDEDIRCGNIAASIRSAAWSANEKLTKEIRNKTHYMTNVAISMEKILVDTCNDQVQAKICLNRLNAITYNANTPNITVDVIGCVCRFLQQHINDLDNKIKHAHDTYDISLQNVSNAYNEQNIYFEVKNEFDIY